MRKILLSAAILFAAGSASAQTGEFGLGYELALPSGSLRTHTAPLHSFNMRAAYVPKAFGGRLSAGIEASVGTYASFTREQAFSLTGTEPTMMDVNYSSNVTTLTAGARYEILRYRGVALFAGLKTGASQFRSGFTIEDPQDVDGCEPLERERLARDWAFVAGAEAGVNVDMGMLIPSLPKDNFYIHARAGLLRGTAVDYINVRRTEDSRTHNHGAHSAPQPASDVAGVPVQVRFVNVGTGQQHQHEVARMHTSPVAYTQASIGFVIRFTN